MSDNAATGKPRYPQDANKLGLALGVIVCPVKTMDEILRRRLLWSGLFISMINGAVASVVTAVHFYLRHERTLFAIVTSNPASTVAALLVLALVANRTARLLGGAGSLADTLTALAWAGVAGIIINPVSLLGNGSAARIEYDVVMVWAFVLSGIAIVRAQRISVARGIVSYVLALLAFGLIFTVTWGFIGLLWPHTSDPVVSLLKMTLTSSASFACITVLSLLLGMIYLPRAHQDSARSLRLLLAGLLIVQVGVTAAVSLKAKQLDPIREAEAGVAAYNDLNPNAASQHFSHLLNYFPGETRLRLYFAHSLAASGECLPAIEQYNRVRDKIGPSVVGPESDAVLIGLGNVHYLQGRYEVAIREFKDARSVQTPDVQSRLALAYFGKGQTKEAIRCAKAATSGGNSPVLAQVVLAEALTTVNDKEGADKAEAALKDLNPSLAKRISSVPGGWVDGLTLADLKMPLVVPRTKLKR